MLGVARTATAAELRHAYRARARLLHPDRLAGAPDNARADAEEEMRALNEAWSVLGDPAQRERYDAGLDAGGPAPPGRPPPPVSVPETRSRLWPWVAVVAVMALVGGVLYVIDGRAEELDSRQHTVEEPSRRVDFTELQVGHCFNTPAESERASLELRPCSEPHDAEVYFVVTHPAAEGAPYPGLTTLGEFARDACLPEPFVDYVGTPPAESVLTSFEVLPQPPVWGDGYRQILCAIGTAGDRLVGSVRATGR